MTKADYGDKYWSEPIPGGPPVDIFQAGCDAPEDDADAEDNPPYRYSARGDPKYDVDIFRQLGRCAKDKVDKNLDRVISGKNMVL